MDRREWLAIAAGGLVGVRAGGAPIPEEKLPKGLTLKITSLKVTPIALPDPPILASSGCHGPYFLRNVVQLETDAGITGIGETHGGERNSGALERARALVEGQNAFAYRALAARMAELPPACYAGVELACLDACGKAAGLRVCDLLGGPVREEPELAAYLFFRYAADHPQALSDPRRVSEGGGPRPADDWGEVRSPESMAAMAARFRERWGFRVFKLKAGVLPPDVELEALKALGERIGGKPPLRIDPNGRWTVETAVRIGKRLSELSLEYYEDPVSGMEPMALVRRETGLPMSTNMCVTRFSHIPEALRLKPVDVVLCDHHGWGGIPACQALGTLSGAAGWGLSQHSNNHAGVTMAAMVHVAALIPQIGHASDTHYPWLPEGADIIEGPNLAIRGGRMKVPEAPGLGVRLDLDRLARAHEVYRKCGMRERDDASTMRRFEPDWRPERF